MASGKTWRPAASSRRCPAAPNASRRSSRRAGHSVCQAASGRSSLKLAAARCSWATNCGAWRAALRIRTDSTGFCFCGMAEDTPRPAARGSASSATSGRLRNRTSVAILPAAPSTAARALPRDVMASRLVCQGAGAARQAQLLGQGIGQGEGRGGRAGGQHGARGQGSRSPAELHRERDILQLPAGGGHAVEPLRRPQPERKREGMLGQAPAHAQRVRMLFRQGGERRRRGFQVGQQRLHGVAREQHQGGVEHVLAGQRGVDALPAPMPATRVQRRNLIPQVSQQRDDGVAAALGADRDAGCVVAARLRGGSHDGGGTGGRQARLLQHRGPAGLDGEDRRQHRTVTGQRRHQGDAETGLSRPTSPSAALP